MKWPHDQSSFFQTHAYWKAVELFFERELKNDGEDITSALLFPEKSLGTAFVTAKQQGVLSGKEEVDFFFESFFPNLRLHWHMKDGDTFLKGSKVLKLQGHVCDLLKAERIMINTLSRMSGVTTQAHAYTSAVNTPLAATRKTQWSYLDKKAVWKGGALTHRIGLFDGVLIKENHLLALGEGKKNIEKALFTALSHYNEKDAKFFEIEVENPDEFLRTYEIFAHQFPKEISKVIMFDNFAPEDVRLCLERIPSQKERHQKNIFLELSGGITSENIQKYDELGADVISIGALTHSVLPIDFSMRMEEKKMLS